MLKNISPEKYFVSMLNEMGVVDIYSLTLVLNAYVDQCGTELIDDIGYNNYTGYAYLYLDNGIVISSCFGQSVQFSINYMGDESDEDPTFNNYYEAFEYLKTI